MIYRTPTIKSVQQVHSTKNIGSDGQQITNDDGRQMQKSVDELDSKLQA